MTVGTYSPWEHTATLRSGAVGSAARGASAPTDGGEGRGHIVAVPAQLVSDKFVFMQAWTGHCAIVPWHRRPPPRRTQAPPGPFEIF